MSLLAIAYPELLPEDFELIQVHRKAYDHQYKFVAPHFTLVFPITDFPIDNFTIEIENQLSGIEPIPFSIHSCIINKDAFSETWHAFLVPDKGNDEIIKLHDRLYAAELHKYLRDDLEYKPHITIGNSSNKSHAQQLADEWNKRIKK